MLYCSSWREDRARTQGRDLGRGHGRILFTCLLSLVLEILSSIHLFVDLSTYLFIGGAMHSKHLEHREQTYRCQFSSSVMGVPVIKLRAWDLVTSTITSGAIWMTLKINLKRKTIRTVYLFCFSQKDMSSPRSKDKTQIPAIWAEISHKRADWIVSKEEKKQ